MDDTAYLAMYQRSLEQPLVFWAEQATQFIHWSKPWQQVMTGNFEKADVSWFDGGELNASYNCLDRHLAERANKTALIWESNDPSISLTLTYQQLYQQVCKMANVLKLFGVTKGDRVCIYLPMIPEAVIAMLACARIGAIHSVVFGGFSADSLRSRIIDASCQIVITANVSLRGNKEIQLKKNVDDALEALDQVKHVLVIKRNDTAVTMKSGRDSWYHDVLSKVDNHCEPVAMLATHPLFILYTSGSTGTPKGILHGTGGYLVHAATSFKYVFDYRDDDIFWCTADVGWITGHTYGVYGPLSQGATILIYEGIPTYPTPSRFWQIIDKHTVSIFYTAPTAIRALRREGDTWLQQTKLDSLRVLGSVGEPLNPEAWEWYNEEIGNNRCPIVDTWWQTETGGIMISPLPGTTLQAGSVGRPFFGIEPAILDEAGNSVPVGKMGKLVIKNPWPGMLQTIYGSHDRMFETYFKDIPGRYLTGDQAHCDELGYFWIAGRSDDVIKVSGHRIGTGEVESALIQHSAVAETAVVGVNNSIKGQSIYAFVSLKAGQSPSEQLRQELIEVVRHAIGAIASPDYIQWAQGLPKTRSGKIMRRLLRKIANNDISDLGDLSTLSEPEVVNDLISERVAVKE